jgi:hypothetical protein
MPPHPQPITPAKPLGEARDRPGEKGARVSVSYGCIEASQTSTLCKFSSGQCQRVNSRPETDRDYGLIAIVSVLVAIAVWLLLMPLVPAIASATLHRFHLRSGSFLLWSIQQPIPSMYNFANRYEVREFPPGLIDPILGSPQRRFINHFPSRVLTFANTRYVHLSNGDDRWVTIESSYRGQTLETRFHAKAKDGGGFELVRLPPLETDR